MWVGVCGCGGGIHIVNKDVLFQTAVQGSLSSDEEAPNQSELVV